MSARKQKHGGVSRAEQELYGGRLRWDQSFVRYEGALTRLGFGQMAAALPQMAGLVLRTGWEVDRRALAGVVAAQAGQGVTAAWGLVAVNSVLTQLFAEGPTADKLRESLPSLVVLAVVSVAAAMLAAWSTAMSGRLEPQVERAVSACYYEAVTRVEVEATEQPEVQRVLEAGKFGTDSARAMLRLTVGVGNVLVGMVAAAVVLVALHWALLPMLLAIALPKGWGAVRSARRDYTSRLNWVDHRRAIASLLAYLTRPHAAGEIRVHAAGRKLLAGYEEMSRQTEAEQRHTRRPSDPVMRLGPGSAPALLQTSAPRRRGHGPAAHQTAPQQAVLTAGSRPRSAAVPRRRTGPRTMRPHSSSAPQGRRCHPSLRTDHQPTPCV
ncbi:hypothetical protein ACFU98_22980 [Streptomyces sp. NPDC057575]|uniref:hypothetical protein n=1 Tax=unclassified Streptomyces TaxID=2593676 RepID=UPI0036CE5CD6